MASRLPTADEARVGGRLAILNACNLFESAEATAGRGNFGAAVGLAVLALEEAAKGRALLGYAFALQAGVPFGLHDKEFTRLLNSHASRYRVAFMQRLTAAGHSLLLGIEPRTEDERNQVQRDIEAREWLVAANPEKQRGFYVDFSDDGWSSPSQVTPDEWEQACRVVVPFLEESHRQDAMFGANPAGRH